MIVAVATGADGAQRRADGITWPQRTEFVRLSGVILRSGGTILGGVDCAADFARGGGSARGPAAIFLRCSVMGSAGIDLLVPDHNGRVWVLFFPRVRVVLQHLYERHARAVVLVPAEIGGVGRG